MKSRKSIKFYLSIAGALAIALLGLQLSTAVALAQVNGEIQRVWVDHNVYEDGKKGMRIHVQFTARNMQGATGHLAAYFSFENGAALKDYNGRYNTRGGNVSVGSNFVPKYAQSTYNDFRLFMPYDELHLASGKHRLEFDVVAFHTLGTGYTEFSRSNGLRFTYNNTAQISQNCLPRQDEIALFEHSNFQGKCVRLRVGEYRNSRRIGLKDNSVSSVRIGDGVNAALCADPDFQRCGAYPSQLTITNLADAPLRLLDSATPSELFQKVGNDTLSSVIICDGHISYCWPPDSTTPPTRRPAPTVWLISHCYKAVQGQIAWDYQGSKTWNKATILRLCKGNERSVEPAQCFARVMHGGVNWGGGTRWKWQNAVDLCEGTHNASSTINCFKSRIRRGESWSKAIASCGR